MDHSPSVLPSDDAPSADPDESPRPGAVSQEAVGAEPDADISAHLDGQPRDAAAPDADPSSDARAAPPAAAAADVDSRPDAETRAGTEDAADPSAGPYPDDSLWPANGVRALRSQGLGAELTPRSTVDPFPLLARDRSGAYPMASGPVDPRALAVPERVRRPRPVALVLIAAAVVLAFAGASVGYSLLVQQKLYGAQAAFQLTVRPDLSDTQVDRETQTQLYIVTSPLVLGPVATQTGVGQATLEDEVSAGIEGRSTILLITVADPDQEKARVIATAVADAYARVTPKPPSTRTAGTATQTAPITVSLMPTTRALGQLQPQPVRALAVGLLVGLLVAGIVVVVLWRPWTLRRPASYWT